eukprot:3550225-Pyramimonas_sp.AAC.1
MARRNQDAARLRYRKQGGNENCTLVVDGPSVAAVVSYERNTHGDHGPHMEVGYDSANLDAADSTENVRTRKRTCDAR